MDYVRIVRDQGYGDGMWQVIKETGHGSHREYTLRSETGEVVNIYAALTYQDVECVRKRIEEKRQAINKILTKPKTGAFKSKGRR